MKLTRDLSCGFAAGVVGAVVLMAVLTLMIGFPSEYTDFKIQLYRLMIWGGIWGLLLILPLLKQRWFIRGSLLGLTVILFNFIVLMPLSGRGFFAMNAGLPIFFGNIILNYIWGVVAGFWYHKTR